MTAKPDYAVSPGEYIAEWMESENVDAAELARRLRIWPKHIIELLSGIAPLSHSVALALERVTGVPARVWNQYESGYRNDLARRRDDCVFCRIIEGSAPANIVESTGNTLMFVPRGPVVDGHVVAVPKTHVQDAAEYPDLTGIVVKDVSRYAARVGKPFNLISSAGVEATQSVFHLHIHYVPRAVDDLLMVPWGTLHGENPQDPHRCKGMVALEERLERIREES